MKKIYNPKNVKNVSPETTKKHTFVCAHCGKTFVNLNLSKCKYCSRKCASDGRKASGWKPSEETRKRMAQASTGRKLSEEALEKLSTSIRKAHNPNKAIVKITRDALYDCYVNKKMTLDECAEFFVCTRGTISRSLKKHGIKGRYGREAQITKSKNDGRYTDREWLYKQYYGERKGTTEIAEMCNCGKTTIKRWMDKFGFELRDNSTAHLGIKRSPESRKKQSESVSGENNPFYGKTHSEEVLKNIAKKQHLYPKVGGFIKWYGFTTFYGKFVKLQGTYELETARFFDRKGIVFLVHGEIDGFSYVTKNGRRRIYTPDFYLSSTDTYIEVKGYYNNKMKAKMDKVVEEHGITLEVWDVPVLREKGILKPGHDRRVTAGEFEEFLLNND